MSDAGPCALCGRRHSRFEPCDVEAAFAEVEGAREVAPAVIERLRQAGYRVEIVASRPDRPEFRAGIMRSLDEAASALQQNVAGFEADSAP